MPGAKVVSWAVELVVLLFVLVVGYCLMVLDDERLILDKGAAVVGGTKVDKVSFTRDTTSVVIESAPNNSFEGVVWFSLNSEDIFENFSPFEIFGRLEDVLE